MRPGSVVGVIIALVVGGFVGVEVYNHLYVSQSGGNPRGTVTTITLSYGGGTCAQNGSTNPVTIPAGSTVTWQSDTGVPVQIAFPPSTSPFYQTGSSAPVSSGQAYPQPSQSSTTYNYQSITFGTAPQQQSCNNPGQLGMIVKW